MHEPRMPKYPWGLRVCSEVDLYNDGTYPGQPVDAILVSAGISGEIVNIGHHAEANVPVYLVEFSDNKVIGCLEEEIRPMAGPMDPGAELTGGVR